MKLFSVYGGRDNVTMEQLRSMGGASILFIMYDATDKKKLSGIVDFVGLQKTLDAFVSVYGQPAMLAGAVFEDENELVKWLEASQQLPFYMGETQTSLAM